MKKTHFSIALFLTLLSMVFGCKKNNEVVVSTTPPTLTLSSPNNNDQLLGGQVLTIKGDVADKNGLHTLSIKITDDKTAAVLFQSTPSVLDAKIYALNTTWTVKVSDWTDATMTIVAANHAGLKTEKIVKFKLWL